jgi:lysylphosphatidylglycerol synthetase-like protein (DUF2156 family)
MDRLRDIPDDCDVAEFDSIVLKGREIKRLRPGACVSEYRWNEWFESLRFCFQAHGFAMVPSMRGLNTWVQSKHMLWIDHLSLLLIFLLQIRSGAPS